MNSEDKFWEKELKTYLDYKKNNPSASNYESFYPEKAYSFARMISIVSPHMQINGAKVLEPGCGMGIALCYLVNLGAECTGLDISSTALDYASFMKKEYKISDEKMKLLQQNFLDFKEKEKYELVFNSGVLEHYTFDEQVKFINLMKDFSNNLVCILVPNLNSPSFQALIESMHKEGRVYNEDHLKIDVEELFKQTGLELIDKDGIEIYQRNHSYIKKYPKLYEYYKKDFSEFNDKNEYSYEDILRLAKQEEKIDKADRLEYGFSTVYLGKVK